MQNLYRPDNDEETELDIVYLVIGFLVFCVFVALGIYLATIGVIYPMFYMLWILAMYYVYEERNR